MYGYERDQNRVKGFKVDKIEIAGNEGLRLTNGEGGELVFFTEGDCCSHSWIEHLNLPRELGRVIIDVIDNDAIADGPESISEYEYIQYYSTSFIFDNGERLVVDYRNSSNGYYGGDLVLEDEDRTAPRLDPWVEAKEF